MRCVASVCAYLIALQASATDLPALLEMFMRLVSLGNHQK